MTTDADVPGELPEHVRRNREAWDSYADEFSASGERDWAVTEPGWGIFRVPESLLHLLPDDMTGMEAIELGCGTAYVSAWMARRGASVTGIDNSPRQLETARRLQEKHDLHFPVMLGNAEQVPLPDASFDFAISEYGASIWADPYRWVPEAARLLRPEGELVFLVNGTLQMLTIPERDEDGPPADRLLRPYFGMHRFEWPGEAGVEFHLGYGDWIRLLRRSGFDVLDMIEVRPPDESTTSYTELATLDWAQQWPCEEVWKARRR